MFGRPYRNSISLHVETALTGMSHFISVSHYPEIAMGVTQQFKDGKAYIFKITTKESDLVRIDPENGVWSAAGSYFDKKVILTNGNQRRIVPANEKVESLIFFRIPPTAIEEIPVNGEMNYEFAR